MVPTGLHYSYKSNLISNKHRYNMLKLLTKHNEKIEVSDYEFQDEEIHTYDTLEHYKNIYKNSTIYFICGLDNLSYINKWYKAEKLLKNYKFLVIGRNTNNSEEILNNLKEYKENITITNIELNDISSTKIRDNIYNKDFNYKKYLNKEVYEYIIENNLYK